jgi:hypothetical protein
VDNEIKLWRYMDLAKFISLISTKSLYFAPFNSFQDPYEGYLPNSHYKEYQAIFENILDISKIKEVIRDTSLIFAASCWHMNDYENEALWKIYTDRGGGIAIETTDNKLKQSFVTDELIICNKVRYEDFDNSLIERGHEHYSGFIKRKAFEYEKEYRAVIKAAHNNGCFVEVNLDTLIQKIHISPLVPNYFFHAVEYVCKNNLSDMQSKIIQSSLYEMVSHK